MKKLLLILLVILALITFVACPPKSPIKVTAPTGTSTVIIGEDFDIKWTYTGDFTTFDIALIKPDTTKETIATGQTGTSGAGTYTWSVSTSLTAGTGYKVEVSSGDESGVSPAFEIKPAGFIPITFDMVLKVKQIGDDVYVAGFDLNTAGTSVEKFSVLKNREEVGSLALPTFSAIIQDIYVDGDDVYLAGCDISSSPKLYYAGYWKNDGSAFVKKGTTAGNTYSEWIISMISLDDYVTRIGTGDSTANHNLYVNNNPVTLSLAGIPGTSPGIVSTGNMTTNGTDIYLSGNVSENIADSLATWHPVVWKGDGSLDIWSNYTSAPFTPYEDLYVGDTSILATATGYYMAINSLKLDGQDSFVDAYLKKDGTTYTITEIVQNSRIVVGSTRYYKRINDIRLVGTNLYMGGNDLVSEGTGYNSIPSYWIETAKTDLTIPTGHTQAEIQSICYKDSLVHAEVFGFTTYTTASGYDDNATTYYWDGTSYAAPTSTKGVIYEQMEIKNTYFSK